MQQWWPFPKRITKLPLFLSVEKQQQHTIRSSAISQRRDNYRHQHTEHTHTALNQHWSVGLEREKKQEKNKHCHAQTTIIKTPANLKPPKKKIRTRVSERECRSWITKHTAADELCACVDYFSFPGKKKKSRKKSFLGGMRLTHTHTHTSITDYSGRRNERDPSSHGDFITHTHTHGLGAFQYVPSVFGADWMEFPFYRRESESLWPFSSSSSLYTPSPEERDGWGGGDFQSSLFFFFLFFCVCC